MHASVHAFLERIIDYAGLFPPAKLPLEEAIQQYQQLRAASPHQWMLGPFVCPTGRLSEFPRALSIGAIALGQQAARPDELLPGLQNDICAIQAYRSECGYDGKLSAIEFALPKGVAKEELLRVWPTVYEELIQANLSAFVEIPAGPDWRELVESNWGAKALKIRCGGLTADAFPSDADVAFFIHSCRTQRIRWKATAGLHHPRRHWDNKLQVWHHGFLNVFAAGVLAWMHPISETDLVELLADRELRNLRFEPERMVWKSWECDTLQIAAARSNFATSFGSCSFDEPTADLIAMGLLER